MTRRMQDSRITALEVALQECSTGDTTTADSEKQSSNLLLNSRKLRRLRSFEVHTNPVQDRLAMELASELKREKRRISELKHANSDFRQSAVEKDQRIASLEMQVIKCEKCLSTLGDENKALKIQAAKIEELQDTLKVLQQKLMQQVDGKPHQELNRALSSPIPTQKTELTRKESVTDESDDSGYSTPIKQTMAALQEENSQLKRKLKDKTVRLSILESALKEKMQTIAVLQSQPKAAEPLLTEL
ncbi:uncharacterized protein LOC134186826 isoform X2 [Corticium candelabrum]|nr:uncharacterized protein LOC134186826 isoform X2 [Corticium candelabrum]